MSELYHIHKKLILENGIKQNVVLIDSQSEVLEYTSKEEAINVAEIFEANSEKGWKYKAIKVGFQAAT